MAAKIETEEGPAFSSISGGSTGRPETLRIRPYVMEEIRPALLGLWRILIVRGRNRVTHPAWSIGRTTPGQFSAGGFGG